MPAVFPLPSSSFHTGTTTRTDITICSQSGTHDLQHFLMVKDAKSKPILVLTYLSDVPHFRDYLTTSCICSITQAVSCLTFLHFSTQSLFYFTPDSPARDRTPASSLRLNSDIISFKKYSPDPPLPNTQKVNDIVFHFLLHHYHLFQRCHHALVV